MQPEDTRRIEDWALNPTVVDDSKGSRSGRQSEPERWGIADEQLPERLGRFRIVGMLGQGGMGRVLEAHDDTLDRRVAVKQLHQDAGPGHRQRMLREAQALARLSHPNVIQVYDAAEQDGRLFIAMELVDGQTLWDWHKTPRPWPECVRVYEEAARGLAAAHAEGIVHRDFKPANCIIDDRGRVKVLDFGLARGVDDMDEAEPSVEERVRTLGVAIDPVTVVEPGLTRVDGDLASPVAVVPRGDEDDARDGEAPPDSADASPSPARSDDAVGGRAIVDHSGALSLRLTQTGAMLGTPAYMAPEQAAGRPPDARSDQFSLCVALFEAIYGERPYAGSPGFALLADEGAGLEFPRVRAGLPGVPGWLRKVLARGLSADKVDRFPTMVALLEAIERGHRRRRRVGLAVAAAGVLAAAGLWMAGAREAAPCEGLRDAGLPGWGASQRTAVREALGSEGGERGEALWTATERGLDEYARAWSDVRARACEATHVERVASPELLELRSACLDARALRVQATVEQLSSADSQVAAHAAQAVRSLPPVEPCLDAERLRGVPPLPPALADDASEIRRLLARSWALDATGRAAEGLPAANLAVERAEALGEPGTPLLAEARYSRGRLDRAVGRLADARRDLEAVVELAERVDDEALAIDGLRELLGVSLDEADRSASAAWMAVVRGKLLRFSDRDPRREAELHTLEGLLALHDERYDAAVAELGIALARLDELDDDEALSRAQVLLRLAMAQAGLGHDDEARQAFERAGELARREGMLPLQAQVLHELGSFHDQRGRADEAERALRSSLELRVGFDGPTAPVTIPTRTLLARLLAQRGELDEAYAMADAARRSLGPGVPAIRQAQVLTLLASFQRVHSDWEGALGSYRRAREAWSTLSAPDEVELAMLDASMADCLMMLGDPTAARTRYEGALQTLKVRVPDDDPLLVYPLLGLAHLLYEQGDRPGAVAQYRRALVIQRDVGDNPELSAVLRWELGRAVLEQDGVSPAERAEAVALLQAARQHFQGVGDSAMVTDIDAFTHDCGPRCSAEPEPPGPTQQQEQQ